MAETKPVQSTSPEQPKAPEAPAAVAQTPPVETKPAETKPRQSKGYVVTGAAVVLPIEGGSERYLYRGALIGTGYTEDGIKHALSVGLIEKQK